MNKITKALRFLNLLEPPNAEKFPILSLSKLFLWMMIFAFVYILIVQPGSVIAFIGAVSGLFMSSANYAWRRFVQHKNPEEKFKQEHIK